MLHNVIEMYVVAFISILSMFAFEIIIIPRQFYERFGITYLKLNFFITYFITYLLLHILKQLKNIQLVVVTRLLIFTCLV